MPRPDRPPTLPLEVGRVYVNDGECIARHIIQLRGSFVYYEDFGYPEGDPFGAECRCGRGVFRKWAKRMISPEEQAQIPAECFATLARERETMAQYNLRCLSRIHSYFLVEELKRRGYLMDDVQVAPPEPERGPRTRRIELPEPDACQ